MEPGERGTGFDVVPSDCLAALLKQRLPGAASLELAFATRGGSSPGTMKTALENAPRGGLLRRGGKLVRVPPASLVREVPFADKPRLAMSIPWGDLATAYRSTGIPDITVYMAASPAAIRGAQLLRYGAPLLALKPVQAFLRARIEQQVKGPDLAQRALGSAQFWGRVTTSAATDAASGATPGAAAASASPQSVEMTLQIGDGYTFTAEAALECAARVLAAAVQPGAWTPSLAFGADFAASLPGVRTSP